MIIFGTRGVHSTISNGQFNCPQCEVDRPYKLRKVTKFFTLYFIPLIPLGRKGEYVECGGCKATFIPNVLKNKTISQKDVLSEYEKAMKHALVLMMKADGEIDQTEKEVVVSVINKISHHDITMDDLEHYIEEVGNDMDVSRYLKNVSGMLNNQGKEMVIRAAFSVAAADGVIDPSEIEMLFEMGDALELSKAYIKGIMQDIKESAQASQN